MNIKKCHRGAVSPWFLLFFSSKRFQYDLFWTHSIIFLLKWLIWSLYVCGGGPLKINHHHLNSVDLKEIRHCAQWRNPKTKREKKKKATKKWNKIWTNNQLEINIGHFKRLLINYTWLNYWLIVTTKCFMQYVRPMGNSSEIYGECFIQNYFIFFFFFTPSATSNRFQVIALKRWLRYISRQFLHSILIFANDHRLFN